MRPARGPGPRGGPAPALRARYDPVYLPPEGAASRERGPQEVGQPVAREHRLALRQRLGRRDVVVGKYLAVSLVRAALQIAVEVGGGLGPLEALLCPVLDGRAPELGEGGASHPRPLVELDRPVADRLRPV